MAGRQLPDLYWTGGSFRVALRCPANTPQHLSTKALAALEEFRSDCQEQYCAFSGPVNGRHLAYERFKPLMASRNNVFFVGTGPPDSEQRPGRSTIAQMRQGDILDSLEPGGAFEDQSAKALVVMMFHRWDEQFRHLIAQTLSVSKDAVECDLMGDVRHVRHLIIHDNSGIPRNFTAKLKILCQIWNLQPGKLRLTEQMIHSLMEQINAIRVRVEA